ncbi:MAG: UPF0016 domain-containing protein [Alphaproteobacteria bacterium]|nr:MAG: UPF0016 domain-containing protein [Alphaproteobacteria bacterium]
MDALLSTFLAAALAEWGDKTQLLVMAIAARHGRAGPVVAAAALAALLNSLLAAAGGVLVHDFVTIRALSLLVALALLFAAAAPLLRWRVKVQDGAVTGGLFLGTFGAFFIAELGDKSQFLTFALAARFDSWLLAAAGATAGIIAASLPAALLGAGFSKSVPVRGIRAGIAIVFLVLGFVTAISALRLV